MSLKKLLSALLVASMVFALVVPAAFAADTATDTTQAVKLLQGFGIVKGDNHGNLNLDKTISRAEMMTVLIRAAGKAGDADLLKGAASFNDTTGHWASGYIALAKAMGLTNGYPDGSFRPDAKVTYAETIAFLVRLVGVDVSKTPGSYPNNYIKAAIDAGIIPAGIDVTKLAGEYAIRGYVFVLANNAFGSVKLATGKTIYQTYFKTTAPTVTVDQGTTLTTAKDSVNLTGSVSTDTVSLTANGKDVVISNGTFSFNATGLKGGDNTINFVAVDTVGNAGSASVKVTRSAGALAKLVPSLTDKQEVTAGSTTAVSAVAQDSYGTTISNAAVTVTAANGKVDDKGNYTAPEKVGTDTLTFTSGSVTATATVNVVAGPLAAINIAPKDPTIGQGAKVTFTATGADKLGNPVTAGLGTVTWNASAGVIDQQGNFAGTVSGKTTITATANGVSGTSTATVFGVPTALNVTLSKASFTANASSTSTATAAVVDANGVAVGNWNGNVTFTVSDPAIATVAGGVTTQTVTAVNGVATVTLTSAGKSSTTNVGTAVVQATATGLTGGTASLTTTAQKLGSIALIADPATVSADGGNGANGSFSVIKVKLLDQDGVQMGNVPTGGVVVTLTSGQPQFGRFASNTATVTFGTNDPTYASSTAVAPLAPQLLAGANPGSTLITGAATVGGATFTGPVTSATVSTVLVGGPTNLSIDTVSAATAMNTVSDGTDLMTIVVRVRDAAGNQVTGYNGNQTISLSGNGKSTGFFVQTGSTFAQTVSTATAPGLSAPATNGKVVFYAKDANAESVTFTATSGSLTQATATGVFNAGPVVGIKLSATPADGAGNPKPVALGSGKATLKASVVDANGNAVSNGTYAVTFHRETSNNTFVWSGDQTVNTTTGVATLTINAGSVLNSDTFTASATINGVTQKSAVQSISTQVIGPSNQLTFDTASSTLSANAVAGTALDIYVNVLDGNTSYGPFINTSDNSTVVTLTATDSKGNVTTNAATAAGGIAHFSVNLTTADKYTFHATAGGLKTATDVTNYAVSPAKAAALKIKLTPATIGADGYSHGIAQVQFADQYGNAITNQSKIPAIALTNLTVTGNNQNVVNGGDPTKPITADPAKGAQYFVADCSNTAAQSAAGCAQIPYYTTSLAGVTTLTASIGGGTIADATAAVTSVAVYAPHHLTVSVDGPAKDSTFDNTAKQTVTITLVDASGNTITNPSITAGATLATDSTNITNAAINCGTGKFLNGVVTCTVQDPVAETVNYTATYSQNGAGNPSLATGYTTATVAGTFVAGNAAGVAISAGSPAYVVGNGSSISTVKLSVVDNITNVKNVVTTAQGTATVTIADGNDYAYLVGGNNGSVNVPVTNGVATVTLQSKNATNNGSVKLNATYTSNDGATSFSQNNVLVLTVAKSADAGVAPAGTATYDSSTKTATFNLNMSLRTTPSVTVNINGHTTATAVAHYTAGTNVVTVDTIMDGATAIPLGANDTITITGTGLNGVTAPVTYSALAPAGTATYNSGTSTATFTLNMPPSALPTVTLNIANHASATAVVHFTAGSNVVTVDTIKDGANAITTLTTGDKITITVTGTNGVTGTATYTAP